MNDFIDIKKSETKSKKSKSSVLKDMNEKSEEISLSQLNLIANKRKLQPKKSTEMSASHFKDDSTQKTPPSNKKTRESMFKSKSASKSTSKSILKEERYLRKVARENKDSKIYQL